jgi:hypothetical protein
MTAAGMLSAATIGHKGPPGTPLPWYGPPHPLANAGAAAVVDKRVETISVITIFLIIPPFLSADHLLPKGNLTLNFF